MGFMIGEDYPLLKFWQQYDYCIELKKKEEEAYNKK